MLEQTDQELEAVMDDANASRLLKEEALDELIMKREHERRYLAVRMAVAGEWSALRRKLDMWGIEPLR